MMQSYVHKNPKMVLSEIPELESNCTTLFRNRESICMKKVHTLTYLINEQKNLLSNKVTFLLKTINEHVASCLISEHTA